MVLPGVLSRTGQARGIVAAVVMVLAIQSPPSMAQPEPDAETLACYRSAIKVEDDIPPTCLSAAAFGDAHAMYIVGMRTKNLIRRKELKERKHWLEQASRLDHLAAKKALADIYYEEGDIETAEKYDIEAAEQGYGPSVLRLANTLMQRAQTDEQLGPIRDLLEEQAEAGFAQAQFEYALMLRDGRGGPVDTPGALLWMFEAATSGYVEAQFQLALMLVKDQPGQTLRWLVKAARAGHTKARYELAIINSGVGGFDINLEEAAYWALEAAHDGDDRAAALYNELIAQGIVPGNAPPSLPSIEDVGQTGNAPPLSSPTEAIGQRGR